MITHKFRRQSNCHLNLWVITSGLAINVVNLLAAIPSIPEADPARVGMWGHSMDGAAGPRSAREAQAVKISRSMRQSNCRMNLWVIIARLDGGESRIVL